ncbi:MAG: transketolase C-terminal domain-containing protein [Candidatus Spechtbacterales bacterium]|nr:transketolase C-terminal domain-containing protein [Candidatus Spechtbacterales bacterium]
MNNMKINKSLNLISDLLNADKIEKAKTRDGYGKGLVEAGEKNEDVVVLCADLTESTRSHWFREKFPERFIEVGIAEQNMAATASGLASAGKVAFISSYAAFSPGRNNEQIRTTISYNNWGSEKGREINVKVAGAHAGVSVGRDGATHQALEDVALMRVQPGMTVVVPADVHEAQKATVALAERPGPAYIRFGRAAYPIFTTEKTPFEIGKAYVITKGKDVTIAANGPLVYKALQAASELEEEGIDCEVINNHTVKPLDGETILKSVKKTGAIVTAEEHNILGGMGSAVAEYLSQNHPTPQEFIGTRDRFGESGDPEELFEKFEMGVSHIKEAVKRVLDRKK